MAILLAAVPLSCQPIGHVTGTTGPPSWALATAALTIQHQSDITLIGARAADTTANGDIPMHAPNNNIAPKGLRGQWISPPRSGMRLIIPPWEYRHLRAFAGVRIASGIVLAGLGVVTLSFGGNDWKTYGWTMAFLAPGAANLAFAYWELSIARSAAART